MLSKAVSGLIALTYIVVAYLFEDSYAAFRFALYLLMPMACIWFSEEMGGYTGILTSRPVHETTPGCMVAFGGWMLLLLPIVLYSIAYF